MPEATGSLPFCTSGGGGMSKFEENLAEKLAYARKGAKLWSVAYHGSGFMALATSTAASFVATANFTSPTPNKAAWVAGLAGMAALLNAASALGGFARKWHTNRSTRTALERIQRELDSGKPAEPLQERFEKVLEQHDVGIIGTGTAT